MDQKYSIAELLRRMDANWNDAATLDNAVMLGLIRLTEFSMTKADNKLSPLGLTQASFEVLTTLRSLPEPRMLTPTELYRSILITSGGMTKVLKHLEQDGYIERSDNPDDKRSRYVQLTETGAAFAEEAMMAVGQGDREVLRSGLNEDELKSLKKLLLKALESIEG